MKSDRVTTICKPRPYRVDDAMSEGLRTHTRTRTRVSNCDAMMHTAAFVHRPHVQSEKNSLSLLLHCCLSVPFLMSATMYLVREAGSAVHLHRDTDSERTHKHRSRQHDRVGTSKVRTRYPMQHRIAGVLSTSHSSSQDSMASMANDIGSTPMRDTHVHGRNLLVEVRHQTSLSSFVEPHGKPSATNENHQLPVHRLVPTRRKRTETKEEGRGRESE